jgi:hypothetical protein
MASINDFIKSQKQPGVERQETKAGSSERKSIIITHEFQQFLDLVSVYKDKHKLDWPDLCDAALKKSEEEKIIVDLNTISKSNTERALKLCNVVVDSHRKTLINFAMPTVKVRKIISMPEAIHDALGRKAASCGVRMYVFLQIYMAKFIIEDDPDFVEEVLGKSRKSSAGILAALDLWKEWLADQLQTQQEIETRITTREVSEEEKC